MKTLAVAISLSALLFPSGNAAAQQYLQQTGNTPFTTKIPIDNGYIDVNNGNIHIDIPLAAQRVRGRIPLHESLVYDSRIWAIADNSGTIEWQPTNIPQSYGGWRYSDGNLVDGGQNPPQYTVTAEDGWTTCNGNESPVDEAFTNFLWVDPTATVHFFPGSFLQQTATKCNSVTPQSLNSSTLDGSGYSMKVTYDPSSNGIDAVVYDNQGNEVYPILEDPNGNYYTEGSSGLVDTLGRTPVIRTQVGNTVYFDVLVYGGARTRYTVTRENIYFNTSFGQQQFDGFTVQNASGSFQAIQSIELPDGSRYSFTYDSGQSGEHYGELTGITLPSGGVITLSYQNFQDSLQNWNRWLTSVSRDGGTTSLIPNVLSSQCSGSPGDCQETVTVTTPDNNDTVYTFSIDPSNYQNGGSWNVGVDEYQGSSGSGTDLRSVSTTYTPSVQQFQNADGSTSTYAVPQYQQVLTSLHSTTTVTSQTYTTFDSIGARPVDVKQWDYYSGSAPSTPTTDTSYTYGKQVQWDSSSASVGAFLTLLKTTDGSGSQTISETQYQYDTTTPTSTSGLPQHGTPAEYPANLNYVTQWNSGGGGDIDTSIADDDAGEIVSVTDPNGMTSYGYDATDTFVTSITPPVPSSGISLTWNASYDFSSSLLSSTTDPNAQTTSYANYDVFGRVGEVDYPGSGKTTFTYTPGARTRHR